MLEERGRPGALASSPCEVLVESFVRAIQAEEVEVSSESSADGVVVASAGVAAGVSLLASDGVASLGHARVSWVRDHDAVDIGRRSYSVRSRGTVRA